MNQSQAHRGPDGRGVLRVDDSGSPSVAYDDACAGASDRCLRVALGHCRLAIQDTSKKGLQPMASFDSQRWISFNGEVYNFRELREELEHEGFRFRTRTDTEVILAAWEAWGPSCFARFNGMWAMAIWDGVSRKLILSRDRFGIKPLHVAKVGDVLLFASEIKALLATGLIESRINPDAVANYLKYGMVNDSEATFFKDVNAFPPGHYAEVDWNLPGELRSQSFWTLDDLDLEEPNSFEEASERFLELFESSIDFRMRSDVPVGSCLSGGLDSSSIVCLAGHGEGNIDFSTFTSGSDDIQFDEREWSDLVNDNCGTQSHTVVPDQDGFLSDFRDLVRFQEEPFTSVSIYAQYCVMREARRCRVPVLLDGQGADEALCGYRKFYFFYLQSILKQGRGLRVASEFYNLLRNGDRGTFRWWEGRRYLPSFLQGSRSGIASIVADSFKEEFEKCKLPLEGGASIAERQKADLLRFSVPSLLRYEDRNSMAFSIESRVPFLDHRLVEFLCSLPTEFKLHKGRTKEILRRSMRGIVPDAILDRRDKMGFVTPQQVWMRDRLGQVIRDRFHSSEERISQWVDTPKLHATFDEFLEGKHDHSYSEYFRIFLLDFWIEELGVEV